MIPLVCENTPKKTPWITWIGMAVWTVFHIYSYAQPENRQKFLLGQALYPNEFPDWSMLSSFFFFENTFHFLISILYFWVFTPKLFQEISALKALAIATVSSAVSLSIFCWIHSKNSAPILCTDAFLGALLGAFMRNDIWGSVRSIVIGIPWIRLLDVPSYVLLFFWFFYQFLSHVTMEGEFRDAPMLYLLPLLSFLFAFLMNFPGKRQKTNA